MAQILAPPQIEEDAVSDSNQEVELDDLISYKTKIR
jgi:hypothetical protein